MADWQHRSLARGDEDGFTLLEMIVAVSILAVTLVTLAYGMFGAMNVLQVARHKTAFLQAANAEVESMRALSYPEVGVNASDPDYTTLYPLGRHEGREPVLFATPVANAPAGRTVVTTSPATGLPVPYTILRRVTWTNEDGGAPTAASCTAAPVCVKRLEVEIQYSERGRPQTVEYTSIYYPGNLGPQVSPESERPVAAFVIRYGTTPACEVPTTCATAFGLANTTQFTFDATASTCNSPCVGPLNYYWDFGDGSTATTDIVTNKTFAKPGVYDVLMEVTNTGSPAAARSVTRSVYIGNSKPAPVTCLGPPAQPASNCNRAPVAKFTTTYDPTLPNASPLVVTVDASASFDPDCDSTFTPPACDPLFYTWDWGDCSAPSTGVAPSHRYVTPGTYVITLTVRDPAGLTDTTLATDLGGTVEETAELRPKSIVVSGQECSIVTSPAPFFRNPASNTTLNFIDIKGNGQLQDGDFFFHVRTNQACTTVTFDIPRTTGTFSTALTYVRDEAVACASGVGTGENRKVWEAPATIATSTTFNSGNQSANVRATGGVITAAHQVGFNAR